MRHRPSSLQWFGHTLLVSDTWTQRVYQKETAAFPVSNEQILDLNVKTPVLCASLTPLSDIFALVRYNSQNDSYRWVAVETGIALFVIFFPCQKLPTALCMKSLVVPLKKYMGWFWVQSWCNIFATYDRLKIFSEESVPLFGPPLPSPPVFTDHHEFRDFLLVKCKIRHMQVTRLKAT